MKLSEQFKLHLSLQGVKTFRTLDALNWYRTAKHSPGRVDYSNLYQLILNPLEHEGFIKKHVAHGMWEVSEAPDIIEDVKKVDDVDDFDRYIQEKLKGGSTNGEA